MPSFVSKLVDEYRRRRTPSGRQAVVALTRQRDQRRARAARRTRLVAR